MSDFHFLRPGWLLLLPALLGLAWWLGRRRGRDAHWARVIDPSLLPLLRLGPAISGSSPWPLLALGWTLAVLALAGPSWQHTRTRAYRAPAAWVLVLDLSPSMQATDVPPDRITRARYAIDDLLSAAHDARVALIAFAGEAYPVAPLTDDVATVRLLLGPLSPALMPEHGEQLAPALDEAGRLLAASAHDRGQIVVLTDGFTDPAQALESAERLHEQGSTVNVVGIGTAQGAPQPDGQGGFARDAGGHVLLTRLEAPRLARVAAVGGGQFVTLAGLPQLIGRLQAAHAEALDAAPSAPQLQLTHWRNDGIWLLPPLLLLAALLARRGWL